jgi:glutamyl-tRNA reductase
MKFLVFGLNHRTAPVEVREGWALSPEESRSALGYLSERVHPSEHLVLSTCNRTEFYSHVPKGFLPPGLEDASNDVSQVTAAYARFYRQPYSELPVSRQHAGALETSHFYVLTDEGALAHLFRLASGLDSMILGESQIQRQLRDAYVVAKESQSAGKFLHRLVPAALRASKRVRTSTAIAEGCITPGLAALKLAREALGSLQSRSLLVIGSGKIATSTALAFREANLDDYLVVSRTTQNALDLVARIGRGTVVEWSELESAIERVDLVVSSTGALEPIISSSTLARIQSKRGNRPLVIVDLAIPRDFEPGCASLESVHLYNIDDLNRVIQTNVAERIRHLPHAENIVREEMLAFQRWLTYSQIDPVLRHMIDRFEQIRLGELQSFISHFPPEYHPVLKEMSLSLVKKLLHFPIEKLKSLRDLRGLTDREVAFLKRLFLTDL